MPVEPSQVGLGVENVSDTHILIKEEINGVKEITTYNTKEDALDALNEIRKKLRKTHNTFTECGKDRPYYVDAIIDKRKTVYSVQTVEDAVSTTGKLIWSVNQSVYTDLSINPQFEWRHLFETRQEAEKVYQERLQLYKLQKGPGIRIDERDTYTFIYKNGKLVVDLFLESAEVGTVKDIGNLYLNNI